MRRTTRTRLGLVTAAYALALTAASLLPAGGAGPISGWDENIHPGLQNLLHVPAFGLLAWLLAGVMEPGRLWRLGLAAAACAVFGSLLEWAQAAVPGRVGSLGDVLLNVAGVALGTTIRLARRAAAPRAATRTGAQGATGGHPHDETGEP